MFNPKTNHTFEAIAESIRKQLAENGWTDVFIDEDKSWWGFKDGDCLPTQIPERERMPYLKIPLDLKDSFKIAQRKDRQGKIRTVLTIQKPKTSWLQKIKNLFILSR